jgi:hypothetical protein
MSSKRYLEEFKIETVKQITEVVIAGQAEAAAVFSRAAVSRVLS